MHINILKILLMNIMMGVSHNYFIISSVNFTNQKKALDDIKQEVTKLYDGISSPQNPDASSIIKLLDTMDKEKIKACFITIVSKFNDNFSNIEDTVTLQNNNRKKINEIMETNKITVFNTPVAIIDLLLSMIIMLEKKEQINVMDENKYKNHPIEKFLIHYFYNQYNYNSHVINELSEDINNIYHFFDKETFLYGFLSIITSEQVQKNKIYSTISKTNKPIFIEKIQSKSNNIEAVGKYFLEKKEAILMDITLKQPVDMALFLTIKNLLKFSTQLQNDDHEYFKLQNTFCWDSTNQSVIRDYNKIIEKYFYYHLKNYINSYENVEQFINNIKTAKGNPVINNILSNIAKNQTFKKIKEYHGKFNDLGSDLNDLSPLQSREDLDQRKKIIEEAKEFLINQYNEIENKGTFLCFKDIHSDKIKVLDNILSDINNKKLTFTPTNNGQNPINLGNLNNNGSSINNQNNNSPVSNNQNNKGILANNNGDVKVTPNQSNAQVKIPSKPNNENQPVSHISHDHLSNNDNKKKKQQNNNIPWGKILSGLSITSGGGVLIKFVIKTFNKSNNTNKKTIINDNIKINDNKILMDKIPYKKTIK